MRGRKASSLSIATSDVPVLQGLAHSRPSPWFQVQPARIVLAVAAGEALRVLASRLECDRTTVWRVCRR